MLERGRREICSQVFSERSNMRKMKDSWVQLAYILYMRKYLNALFP